jgi:hypothetical protein
MQTQKAAQHPALAWRAVIGHIGRVGLLVVAAATICLGCPDTAHMQEVSRAAQLVREGGRMLPGFSRCAASPPVLPPRWHAVALMAPFEDGQLDVGEFVYDAALPAMRATVSGVESGTIDLLITSEDTYRLTGPRQSPTACVSSGALFNPPSRQWLSAQAQCAGKAPVMSGLMEWWTMPSENSAATWVWYTASTRLPWRTSRITPSADPAVIGSYAMTNFTSFEALPRTDLAVLRDFCRAGVAAPAHASPSTTSVRALMEAQSGDAGDGPVSAARLVAGLDRQACASVKPPRWPSRFEMTAIMIPTNFQRGPYPAEIFYDWNGANAQLTRLHDPANPSSKAVLDGLLKGAAGYHVVRDESGVAACERAYPGIIRPDWMTNDQCRCRAVVKNNPALDRNDAIQILSCPVKPSGVFWAWYGATGRPITFRSTAVIPSGLTLADYFHFTSKSAFPSEVLDLPAECNKDAPFDQNLAAGFRSDCAGCHVATER